MPFSQPPEFCVICREKAIFKFIRNYQNKDGKFSLYECPKCQVQFWMPFKSPGVKYYKSTSEIRYYQKPERFYHKVFLKRHRFSPSTKILDLGCGTGEFLNELKKSCEVFGVDINETATNVAKNVFKIKNIYPMSCEEFFNLPDLPKYDVITFFEILEHLDNPREFINKIKLLLKPNGFIAMSIPSRERFLANFCRWDFPPGHLTRWDRKSIQNFLQNNGFSFQIVLYGEGCDYIFKEILLKIINANSLTKTKFLENKISQEKMEKDLLLKTTCFLRAFFKKIIHILALFLNPLIKVFGYSESHLYIEAKVNLINQNEKCS
jgi:SAM-dependent methyltransferase